MHLRLAACVAAINLSTLAFAAGEPATTPPDRQPEATVNDHLPGSTIEQLTDLLFADQSLETVVASAKGPEHGSPGSEFRTALDDLNAGKPEQAKVALHRIVEAPAQETRVRLWAWNALRRLGEQPDPSTRRQVRGVVLQVPLTGGTDVLAVYEDGRCRYINKVGKLLVCEAQIPTINARIKTTIAEAQKVVASTPVVEMRRATAPRLIRITLLTDAGLRVVEADGRALSSGSHPLGPTFDAAALLLRDLVELALAQQEQ